MWGDYFGWVRASPSRMFDFGFFQRPDVQVWDCRNKLNYSFG